MNTGISQLMTEIQQAGARTLGEFFAGLDPENRRIRGRWTSRAMYLDEFEKIWAAQSPHHANLTDDAKASIRHAIFFQRPLKSQKERIGRCELETHHRRTAMATLLAQRFRYLQKLNDLEIIAPDGEIRTLTEDQRRQLCTRLEESGNLTFAQVRQAPEIEDSQEGQGRDGQRSSGERKRAGPRIQPGARR